MARWQRSVSAAASPRSCRRNDNKPESIDMTSSIKTLVGSTSEETARKQLLATHLRTAHIPDSEVLDNLGLFLTRQTLSRINFMQRLYEMILPVHGVIMEFGVRWGQNMA